MEVGHTTIKIAPAILKGINNKTDSESVPHLILTLEVIGRAAIENLNVAELMMMVGKPTTVSIMDNQARMINA